MFEWLGLFVIRVFTVNKTIPTLRNIESIQVLNQMNKKHKLNKTKTVSIKKIDK